MLPRWLQRWVFCSRWRTYGLMGVAFFAFGVSTLNLFELVRANAGLIIEHGTMGIFLGGGRQFVELVLTGYGGILSYLVFKACEYTLTHWLVDKSADPESTSITSS
jgi:hypothetical protein